MLSFGAFAVILDEESRVLLSHRTDRDAWNLPGGRIESEETPWEAVVREVEEETGLMVQVERLLGVYAVPAKQNLVFNFLCIRAGGHLRASVEADEHRWFDPADLPPNTLHRHAERIADTFSNQLEVLHRLQA